MSVSLKSMSLAAALLGLPLASLAQDAPTSVNTMTVVRDAETGKLRAPTAAEISALQLRAARSTSARAGTPAATQQKFHASGARGVRLTDEFMSQSVAVRRADGSIDASCVHTQDAVAAAETRRHRDRIDPGRVAHDGVAENLAHAVSRSTIRSRRVASTPNASFR